MCGIVAYFGGAGNNLTRILTAMSAIIYRAPDSTGVGFLGDDVNSLRVRKSLGSVANLIPVLLENPAYPNPTADLLSIFTAESPGVSAQDLQQRLLDFEGFAPDIYNALLRGTQPYQKEKPWHRQDTGWHMEHDFAYTLLMPWTYQIRIVPYFEALYWTE